jgi:hypothetical protein
MNEFSGFLSAFFASSAFLKRLTRRQRRASSNSKPG